MASNSLNITFPGNLAQVDAASDLRGVQSASVFTGILFIVRALSGVFVYDSSSLAADDGTTVLKPIDKTTLQAGRWIKDFNGLAAGLPGAPGASSNTRATLAALKAAPTSDVTSLYNNQLYTLTLGDFTGQNDDINVVQSNLIALPTGAWVRSGTRLPNIITDGRDNAAFVQAIITAGDCLFERRTTPYVLASPITIPAGRQVRVGPGAVFRYTGANGRVFTPASGAMIGCTEAGATFTVQCDTDRPLVWAVGWDTADDVTVSGVQGYRCSHFNFGLDVAYGNIVTPKMKTAGDARALNISRRITIVGGGATFDTAPGDSITGAGYPAYGYGVAIRNATYVRCSHGIQWWGGNADVNVDGAIANERKAQDYLIEGCRAYDCSGGGIWGSMGAGIEVIGCKAYRCGDLSFDVEGCVGVAFVGCHGEDGGNGNFNKYSYNVGITWDGCTAVSTSKARPILSFYNVGANQEDNDCKWTGGRMVCTDTTGPALLTGALGSCRHFTLEGAELSNVAIAMTGGAQGQVTIQNNILIYPYASATAFIAIDVTCRQSGRGQAQPRISGNRIYSEANQPSGTIAIRATGNDPSLPVFFNVDNNQVFIPASGAPTGFAPIKLVSAGTMATRFLVRFNMTDGQIQKSDTGTAGIYTIPDQQVIVASNGATPAVVTTTTIPASNVNQVGQPVPIVTV